MPKQIGQDAETIASGKKPVAKAPQLYNAPYQYFNQALNTKGTVPMPTTPLSQKYPDLSDKMPYAGMTMMSNEAQANPWQPKNPMFNKQQSGIPFPIISPDKMAILRLITSGAYQGVLDPYWNPAYDYNTDYYQGQMNVNDEDKMNYLPDNFSFLYPEQTGSMEDDGSGGDGGGGYGFENYIPMPYDGSWGGGGYGNSQDYLRDSGLINWRI